MVRTSVARKLRAAGTTVNTGSTNKTVLWHSHCSSASKIGHKTPTPLLAIISAQEMNSRPPSSHLRRTAKNQHRQHGTATNNLASNSVLITPPPPPITPPLLLEGDELFISRAGKSRTVYQLKEMSNDQEGMNHSFRDLLLEEYYDIEKARKKMSLLGHPLLLNDCFDAGMGDAKSSNQLADIFSFDLQEINHGVQNGSGTGSMSWDSSIVMGLYFAVNPDELHGNVLELGSGVGLGGILSNVATNMIHGDTTLPSVKRSVTLTDANDDVLTMLQRNMEAAAKSSCGISRDDICIQKLDWFDFLGDMQNTNSGASLQGSERRYDTLIASDCAYLRSQIAPLSETISKLLGNKRGEKLHMFAPYNRGVVHELIQELHEKDMHVNVEELEMSKYRIKQGAGCSGTTSKFWSDGPESLQDGTCGVSKFLHIKAWHKTGLEIDEELHGMQPQMTDID
mmetsp:Transcript_29152/g.61991  ORF Transcript_29152/g.61991 Transcript_29152/m.61991 type:complete len:453 (+) Transcript_29152:115-1473(+)|eukprot:CAMPEP_0172326268 /NCGR_PEP_ID=MMETSP1058-20130122/56057_1 /TAXON_ID=83371 /ORGANISM="Detonula confervacea, Strain CCMP 353" /LENGTH=452 /DNA_ID=CAMNT_0013043013 /DNA_START=95 /DNA_END=1453 /DNA_ORIENTATION=-